MLAWIACAAPESAPDAVAPQATTTSDDVPAGPHDPPVRSPTVQTETLADACPPGRWPLVLLAELLPGNVDGWRDLDGDVSDWVELWDAGGEGADLTGWTLDDGGTASPLAAAPLLPDGRALLAASGKASAPLGPPAGEAHLDWQLDSRGETVTLRAPDGCAADAIGWTDIPADVSLGRDVGGAWAFFLEPTPGGANATESRPRFAAMPDLHPPSGLVVDAVVTVDVPPGTTVRGTLDGSEPSEASTLYEGPFAIDGAGAPVPVRVRAFEEGAWPSPVATTTLIEDDALFDAGLRVVALTVDPPDFFDDAAGIWVYGDPGDYEPWYPYFGANFWEDWERPVHIDLFETDGGILLSQDAGIAIHGGWSRAFDQRGLRLLARSAWLDDDFDVAAFPTLDADRFTALVLHNGGDWCGTHLFDATSDVFLRDVVGRKVQAVDNQGWEPVEVWLNGVYWGLYQMRERLDGDWVETHHPVDGDDLDRLELAWTHAPHWQVEQGDAVAFDAMNALVDTTDLRDSWETYDASVDTENLAALLVATTWYANGDFGTNNLRLWRPRTADGAFRWMLYDLGHGWPASSTDTISWVSTSNWTAMPAAEALAYTPFRHRVAGIAQEWMATVLEPALATARLDDMGWRVEPAIPDQVGRWCPGGSYEGWLAGMDWARDFTLGRTPAYREQLRVALGLGPDVQLHVTVSPAEAGRIGLSTLEVPAPFAATLYAGVPQGLTAIAEPGWVFVDWSGDAVGASAELALQPAGDLDITANFAPR